MSGDVSVHERDTCVASTARFPDRLRHGVALVLVPICTKVKCVDDSSYTVPWGDDVEECSALSNADGRPDRPRRIRAPLVTCEAAWPYEIHDDRHDEILVAP